MITTNFHTHTLFCDGVNTPEELVKEALAKGFTALGFSGHSFFELDKEVTMTKERLEKYCTEIARLKALYKGKIEIFCGIEKDCFSPESAVDFDYVIASVHYVKKNGQYIAVDLSGESFYNALNEFYSGSYEAFAEDYFDTVISSVEETKPDIIGHLDLISKYSEVLGLFETERYLAAAQRAIKALCRYNIPFEINTGAMAKKVKSIPYPSPRLLKMIKENGGSIVFSSDCHDKNYLNCGFALAESLALEAGFTHHGIITENGMKYIPIK